MAQNIAGLRQAIEQYEMQLQQIQLAVDATGSGSDRDNLLSLKSDLEELITLTKENLSTLQGQSSPTRTTRPTTTSEPACDDFDKQYALFKAELEEVEAVSTESSASTASNIQEELRALQGMKCQAPHKHHWGEVSYHNALVCGVEPSSDVSSMDHIQVKIMFTNPTHRDMLPCPYYLEGECRFPDDQCHYSHGEVAPLSELKEYKEPNFSAVRPNVRVLVLQEDKLWHRGVVTSYTGSNSCQVKLESSGKKAEVDLQHVLPLDDEEVSSSDSESTSDSESAVEFPEELVQKSLLQNPPASALGNWEIHTKGIGSRLMAQMGYVTGTGLGKHGEGRIEPVEAMVFPAGKSLDHCMQLRENAGGDKDLFKVEKRLKRLQKKHQQQSERQYEREKQKTNVFDFINDKLSSGKESDSKSTSRTDNNVLKSETCKGLSVVGLRVGEEIRRAEKDLAKLHESLSRHQAGSATHNTISGKLQDKQGELAKLRASESSINKEQNQRKDRKKLSVF